MPDPRSDSDPRSDNDYLIRRGEDPGAVWFWVPALGLVLLIGALLFANNYTNTANNSSSPTATSSAPARTPPSTTGSGSTSPQPTLPAPSKQ